ncbi:MAG: SH3 domain-containing protein [Caldilineaceae bacterium]
MNDLSGKRFEHYYIVERVGENIEGARYTAYDTNPPERAVSLLLVGEIFAHRPGFRERFQQAMDRTQRLNDPSLIGILNHGSWSGSNTCYVITEDPKGHTLREILDRLHDDERILKLTDIITIVREVCTAIELVRLNYLPARDLSPDNILDNVLISLATPTTRRSSDSPTQTALRVVVTDLGFGRIADGDMNDHSHGEIYALGALLYRLIVGENHAAGLSAQRQITPPRILNPALPRSIERIVLTALSPERLERYDNPGLMAIDLTNAYWDAYQYDVDAPHRDRAIDLAHWLVSDGMAIEGIDYANLTDDLLLPAIATNGLSGAATRHKDVRMEVLQHSVEAPPGDRIDIAVRLENVGDQTRHCWIRIVSKPEHITINVVPTSLRLGDRHSVDRERECRLVLQPSISPLCPAGLYRLQFAVIYNQNSAWIESDSVEVSLVVRRIQRCEIDVWPRTLDTGQWGQLLITNRGNAPENLQLLLSEPKGKLHFDIEGITTDRASIILDSGDSEQIGFRPRRRWVKWFGKEEVYPFKLEIAAPEQPLLKSTECQAVSHSLIPLWSIWLTALAALICVGVGLWLFRPQIEYAKNCEVEISVSEPSVALCVSTDNSIGTLTVLPGDIPFDLERREMVLPAPLPDESENTIHLVGQNGISRFLPFLAYHKDIRLPVRQPKLPEPLVPQLLQFCVGDANQSAMTSVCSTPGQQNTLAVTRGQVQTLMFTWQTENVTGEEVELLPQTVPFALASNSAIAPAPVISTTYALKLVDAMGTRMEPLAVTVTVEELKDIVVEPLLYLRKSPGQVYESIALLTQGTEVILLTQPVDYQQNEDTLQWVQVSVADTQETGWVAWEGLSSSSANSITNNNLLSVNDSRGTNSPSQSVTTSDNGIGNSGGSNTSAATENGNANTNGASNALANLPAVLPEFGPTVTPTRRQHRCRQRRRCRQRHRSQRECH